MIFRCNNVKKYYILNFKILEFRVHPGSPALPQFHWSIYYPKINYFLEESSRLFSSVILLNKQLKCDIRQNEA